jgi:hypothetical protein
MSSGVIESPGAWVGGADYARKVRIATFEFQKLVESGTSRLRNVF